MIVEKNTSQSNTVIHHRFCAQTPKGVIVLDMLHIYPLAAILILLTWLTIQIPPSKNSGLLQENVTLGGIDYTDKEVEEAFLSAALSERSEFARDQVPGFFLDDNHLKPERLSVEFPWLYKFIHRKGDVPQYSTINKWAKPPRIAFGMPNRLGPFSVSPDVPHHRFPNGVILIHDARYITTSERYEFGKIQDRDKVIASIRRDAATLSSVTGLPIEFLSWRDDTKEDYAEIRIAFAGNKEPEEGIKYDLSKLVHNRPSCITGYRVNLFRADLERFIPGIVHFTLGHNNLVDGFVLSNSENEIELAVCYIHNNSKIEQNIRECLLRSMGFPGVAELRQASYLSASYSVSSDQADNLSNAYSELDLFFLKTLYSSSVQVGMSKDEVSAAILK